MIAHVMLDSAMWSSLRLKKTQLIERLYCIRTMSMSLIAIRLEITNFKLLMTNF